MPGVSQSIRIHAPLTHVFGVIADFERYPEFLPEIRGVRIGARKKTAMEVTFSAQIFTAIEYTLQVSLEAPERIHWTLLRGQVLRKNEGGWVLAAGPGGSTMATYQIELGFGPLIPGIVAKTLAESTLPNTLKRFKARAETTYRRQSSTIPRGKKAAQRL